MAESSPEVKFDPAVHQELPSEEGGGFVTKDAYEVQHEAQQIAEMQTLVGETADSYEYLHSAAAKTMRSLRRSC